MLGHSRRFAFAPTWQREAHDVIINEAPLRKLMRGHTVRGAHQYWLHFTDEQSLVATFGGRAVTPRYEERTLDAFMLTGDWYSQLVRAQQKWQAIVVAAVSATDDDGDTVQLPLFACLFDVS